MGLSDTIVKEESSRAAILTCILNDMRIIVELMGGKSHTVFSYAGVGDLLLTCMSSKSRNYTLGQNIGKGLTLEQALEKMGVTTVEGLYTLDALLKILEEKQIKLKSLDFLYNSLYRNERIENILRYIKY